jgi:hypothetical protein
MTTTLQGTRLNDLATITITLRNPEWGDVERTSRRQAVGTTDAGARFVEDLGCEDEWWDLTFANLDVDERGDLRRFFRDVGYQLGLLVVTVTGAHLPALLSSDMSVDGDGIGTDLGYTTDQEVLPDTWTLRCRLEGDTIEMAQWRDGLSDPITLRFREERE